MRRILARRRGASEDTSTKFESGLVHWRLRGEKFR
jgi:hypothetical protein